MKPPLRLLHIEDDPDDAELIYRKLVAEGIKCRMTRVERRAELESVLEREEFDLLLSDNTLPDFDGFAALAIKHRKCPDVPFIFVSGTIGEEAAIECLQRGATDYVFKHRLERLPPAVRRALREVQERRERRRAEQRLREQATLLDRAWDAILALDLEGRIGYWNKSAERVYEWTAAEALGRPVASLLVRDPADIAGILAQLFDRKEWSGEARHVTKSGREVTLHSRWTLVRDENNEPRSILIINTDVTAEKDLEAQLLRTQRMETIGSLAGGIAHDLNNVFAPILLSVQLLRKKAGNRDCDEWLDTLESSVNKGANLIKQILAFGRGTEGLAAQRVEVAALIGEARKLLTQTLPASIRLQTRIARNLRPVSGDPTQLLQVLMNLCVNARDAMPEGGKIRLSARNAASLERPGDWIAISVADKGTGIPPHLRERIFEPFYTTKEVGQGTGLGLATVQAIVRRHHGFIRVRSREGKGSRFEVFLPAVPGRPERRSRGKASSTLPEGRGEGILVVDDEAAVREIAKATLENFGYRVWTAAGAAEGLALLANLGASVNVILTDLMMPGGSGDYLIREARAQQPELRFLLLSGSLQSDAALKLSGEVEMLQKPFTADRLLRAIGRCLREERSVAKISKAQRKR